MHSILVVLLAGVGIWVAGSDAAFIRRTHSGNGDDSGYDTGKVKQARMTEEDSFRQQHFFNGKPSRTRSSSTADNANDDYTNSGEMATPDPHRRNRINNMGCECEHTQSQQRGDKCRITSAAPKGKYCFCTYVGSETCHGYAYDCPSDKMQADECRGTCTSDKCCKNIPEIWTKMPDCVGRIQQE